MQTTLDPKVEAKQRNRRRSQRRRPRTTVKVQCRKGSHGLGPNLAVSMLDLADCGMRVILSQELELGAECEIIIVAYGIKEVIKRLGHVRWQLKLDNGQFCVGIELQKRIRYRDWQNLASPR